MAALLLFFACGEDEKTRVITTAPPIDPPPAEEPITDTVKAVLWSETSIKFYDGTSIWEWYDGYSTKSENRAYTKSTVDGNILYYLDEYGQTVASRNLVVDPEYIVVHGTDIWIAENIEHYSPMLKTYTKIYLNGSEYGNWIDRQYECAGLHELNGEIFIEVNQSQFYSVNDSKINIKKFTNEWVCHDYNSTTRRAYINNIYIAWETNFFNAANEWMRSGSIWYSQNGYTWNGSTLIENGSAMTQFRFHYSITGYYEIATLIKAGTRFENGETVLYYIECNSGWVIRYVPSIDQLQLKVRLYTGDGFRDTGLMYKDILFPVVIDDYLYFRFEGSIYRYDFTTNTNSYFTNGTLKVIKF